MSALISLVGLTSVGDKRSVNNFSQSGVRKSGLMLNVKGTNRPCRNVKHKRLGVRKVPMCQSTIKNMNAPADSGRQAGVSSRAARLLTVVGTCDNDRNLRRSMRCVIGLLGRFTSTRSMRLLCFR